MENKTSNETVEKKEQQESTTPRSRRIVAWIGIILLLLMYLVTLVSAIFATPYTAALFKGCMFGTFIIPILIFCYMRFAKLLTGR